MESELVAATEYEASKVHHGLWALRRHGRIRG